MHFEISYRHFDFWWNRKEHELTVVTAIESAFSDFPTAQAFQSKTLASSTRDWQFNGFAITSLATEAIQPELLYSVSVLVAYRLIFTRMARHKIRSLRLSMVLYRNLAMRSSICQLMHLIIRIGTQFLRLWDAVDQKLVHLL